MKKALNELDIIIKGAGKIATEVACRLHRANFKRILMLETAAPVAVRRRVSFCEAVYEKTMTVEGIEVIRVYDEIERDATLAAGKIAVLVDPQGECVTHCKPDVLIDSTLAKRNLGTTITDAPLVIALGPGFLAGTDCHVVIETNCGHNLGRLISVGMAEANTGIPDTIAGYNKKRLLRAPADGLFTTQLKIGDRVRMGDILGTITTAEVSTQIDGILSGLIKLDSVVTKGLKIGDIDPRGEASYCDTISDKARALGGAVLEAILSFCTPGNGDLLKEIHTSEDKKAAMEKAVSLYAKLEAMMLMEALENIED